MKSDKMLKLQRLLTVLQLCDQKMALQAVMAME
jgi:hypothetical protein